MEDSHGDVWYSSSQGVARRSGARWLKLQPYGPAGHGAFRTYEDAQGNVWVAKIEGLFRAKAASLELVIPKMAVRSVFSDRDGNLWVGTNGDGLYRFSDPAIRMFTTADGLPSDVIMTVLAAHDGSIWTGANCGGLTRFDGAHFRTYSEKDGLLNSCVWALAEDANHDLWIGTWGGGAFRFHEGRFTQVVLVGEVQSIVAARDGSVWFATHKGLARLKDGHVRNYTKADGLSIDYTLKVFEDREGRILASNWGGIDRFVGDRFENLSQVPKTLALPMGEDRSGRLFVLLEDKRAALRIERDRVDTVPELVGNRSLIETDSGELWFGSVEALMIHRFPPGSLARPRPRDEPLDDERFGALDGLKAELSGGNPDMALGHGGTIWIATPRGLAMCDPHRLPTRVASPMIYMTEVTVGRETLPAPRELRLQPGTSHVEVGFAAVEVTSPEKIRMQYRLDGVDSEWLDAGANLRAIYSNIPVGAHALRIRACNRGGVWDRAGIAYSIQQQPHFYQTPWFVAVMAATGLVLVGGVHRLRVREVSRRLNARFDERLRERVRVAGELHDTFLQTVQGSKLVADHALKDREDPARLLHAVEQLADWLARATEEGRAALHSLRTATPEPSDLSDALRRAIDECRAPADLDATLSVTGDARALHPIVGNEVYRIAHEAIRNACAHSGAKILKIALDHAHDLTLRADDNGVGMDPALVEKGKEGHFGLRGMRERAERIGARLTITSSPGAGTTILVSVPGRIAYRSGRPGRLRRIASVFSSD
jgi:signal transduction histidine kinase/streptogramin lyase